MKKIAVLVDADACPVKDEIYRVAERLDAHVTIVTNTWMRIPHEDFIDIKVVTNAFDAADDWIAEHANLSTLVVTADILLAERCLKKSAHVISPTGKVFDQAMIGSAVAMRSIMADLRAGIGNDHIGGPPPFSKANRARFLQTMDAALKRVKNIVHSN